MEVWKRGARGVPDAESEQMGTRMLKEALRKMVKKQPCGFIDMELQPRSLMMVNYPGYRQDFQMHDPPSMDKMKIQMRLQGRIKDSKTLIYRQDFQVGNICDVVCSVLPGRQQFLWTRSGGAETRKCWACAREATVSVFLFCPSCNSVQPIDHSINYFQIFDLEPEFDLDTQYLERKYKEWQKKLHPDLFQSRSDQDKENSALQSALVITAYNVLLKPLSRAKYLVHLKGIHVDEEKTVSDPVLLMEIMELREVVDETNDLSSLKDVESKIQEKLEKSQLCFKTAYKQSDFSLAISAIQEMSYYENIKQEIIKKL